MQARAYEQLRLSALESPDIDPDRISKLQRERRGRQPRRAWLLEVEEHTAAWRAWMAARHRMRAQYSLNPQRELIKAPKQAKARPFKLQWCDCAVTAVVAEEHAEMHVCSSCHHTLKPQSLIEWKDYGDRLLKALYRSHFCDCEGVIVSEYRHGLEGCTSCGGFLVPDSHDYGPAILRHAYALEQWQTFVVELYERLSTAVLRWAETEVWRATEHLARFGFPRGSTPEKETERLEELARACWIDPQLARYVHLPIVDEEEAPRGSVSSYHWHMSRATGQEERIDRVMQCGAEEIVCTCGECGKDGPRFVCSCDNHRLCLGCRGQRVRRFRRRFQDAQKGLLRRVWADPFRLGKTHYRTDAHGNKRVAYGGRWGEKFLTLTLPDSGDVRADVDALQRAWTRFWRLLRTHVVKDVLRAEDKPLRRHVMQYMRYCRVLEVTEGRQWQGHAHLHVWLVIPFVHHELLAHLWGQALAKSYQNALVAAECVATVDELVEALPHSRRRLAETQLRQWLVTRRGRDGRPLALAWRPVLDIRPVRSDAMGAELCKYLVKDGEIDPATGRLQRMDPEVFARIYRALEGRRAITSARGLLEPPISDCYCHHCGGVFRRRIERAKALSVEARGPPAQLELALGAEGKP